MIILKSRIQSMLNSQREKGYKEGLDYAEKLQAVEMEKVKAKYDIIIMELKSALHVMETKQERIIKMEKEAIEKDRLANEKMVQAQEIVVQVQQVLNTISDTAVRGRTDIAQIRDEIEKPVKKILEN